jgi:hypothetical protein
MSVQRYRRKPKPGNDEDQFAARYEPGGDLGDLTAVARMAGGGQGEVREVAFPSGKRVLLAWFMRCDDHHPARPDYTTVEAGEYLAYSSGNDHLYEADEGNWSQFYDLATGEDGNG